MSPSQVSSIPLLHGTRHLQKYNGRPQDPRRNPIRFPPIVDFVATKYTVIMKTMRYVYWQHDNMWLGYLEESPDYWTQGETLDELQENLKDLYQELTSGNIPEVRRVAKLQVS